MHWLFSTLLTNWHFPPRSDVDRRLIFRTLARGEALEWRSHHCPFSDWLVLGQSSGNWGPTRAKQCQSWAWSDLLNEKGIQFGQDFYFGEWGWRSAALFTIISQDLRGLSEMLFLLFEIAKADGRLVFKSRSSLFIWSLFSLSIYVLNHIIQRFFIHIFTKMGPLSPRAAAAGSHGCELPDRIEQCEPKTSIHRTRWWIWLTTH